MKKDAGYRIERLGLQKHPEGGYFKESYRSEEKIDAEALPDRFSGPISFSTAIYFLLVGEDFSALHPICSDELWHFYSASPLCAHVIDEEGGLHRIKLGGDPENGERFQAAVKAGCWFGSRLEDPDSYALVKRTLAPGFDFADFEMGVRERLIESFPEHRVRWKKEQQEDRTRRGGESWLKIGLPATCGCGTSSNIIPKL